MDEVRVLLATERRALLDMFVNRECEGRPRLLATVIAVNPIAKMDSVKGEVLNE
jgi:hypothetical protein